MNENLLERLCCPQTGQRLWLESADSVEGIEGWLVSQDGHNRYPIRNGIPRFVPETNYADNFGLQWNHFAKTQLDSHSGHPISADRFWKATGWNPNEMKDRWVLDVGCGSGRFAEIALSTGAQVVALDYSSAVDACWANLKHHPNLHVVQGDIYALPFVPESFDFVYSLGVLQHTPDVARAFAALPLMVAWGGGNLCRLLREIAKEPSASKILAAALHQAHGQAALVCRGEDGRTDVAARQPQFWAVARHRQLAQTPGARGRLRGHPATDPDATAGVGSAGYLRLALARLRPASNRRNGTELVRACGLARHRSVEGGAPGGARA